MPWSGEGRAKRFALPSPAERTIYMNNGELAELDVIVWDTITSDRREEDGPFGQLLTYNGITGELAELAEGASLLTR